MQVYQNSFRRKENLQFVLFFLSHQNILFLSHQNTFGGDTYKIVSDSSHEGYNIHRHFNKIETTEALNSECNRGAGVTWHGFTGCFYLFYVETFPMVYQCYSFKFTIGKVHTDSLGALRFPYFKCLSSSQLR